MVLFLSKKRLHYTLCGASALEEVKCINQLNWLLKYSCISACWIDIMFKSIKSISSPPVMKTTPPLCGKRLHIGSSFILLCELGSLSLMPRC